MFHKLVVVLAGVFFLAPATVRADDLAFSNVVFPLVSARLSSPFGKRVHPVKKVVAHHHGIDLAAPSYAHVRSVSSGLVIFAGTHGGYGKLVTIRHDNGYLSLYGHLNEISVNLGDRLSAGQILGRVGSSGRATGPHLHFELRRKGKPVDPLKLFPELSKKAQG